jgi:hypothetical protein
MLHKVPNSDGESQLTRADSWLNVFVCRHRTHLIAQTMIHSNPVFCSRLEVACLELKKQYQQIAKMSIEIDSLFIAFLRALTVGLRSLFGGRQCILNAE